jgi:hypothetical protein
VLPIAFQGPIRDANQLLTDCSTSSTIQGIVVQHLEVRAVAPEEIEKLKLFVVGYEQASNTEVDAGWMHAVAIAHAPTKVDPFRALFAAALKLRELPTNWDGYGAPTPNATAAAFAKVILEECLAKNFVPSAVVPSSEGGIAVTFRRGVRYADIECFNEGDLFAAFDSGEGVPTVWPVGSGSAGVRAAIDEIRDRLRE